jgi:glycerol-3-phosphate acyltransferase PlsY
MPFSAIRTEIPRTFFHILGGLAIAAIGHLLDRPLNVIVLGVIFMVALTVDLVRLKWPTAGRLAQAALGPFMRSSEEKGLTGAPAFTAGVFLAFLLFSKQAALLSLVPLIFGDRAGLLVGKGFGRIKMWGKTLEGSLACFAVSLAVYLTWYYLATRVFSICLAAPAYSPAILAGAAAVGTVAEALPRPSDDNLVIPLAVGLFLTLAA